MNLAPLTIALRRSGPIHVASFAPRGGGCVYTFCGRKGHAVLASWRCPICRRCLAALRREGIDPKRYFGWHPEFGGREGE